MKYLLILAVECLLVMILPAQETKQEEGYINVEGGKIWYKKLGEGGGIPLLMIHGGPGGRSCSYIPGIMSLAKDRPVILYDQLESGNSDRPGDTTLWKLPRFVNEIDSIRKALKLDTVHLMGSSWGGTILVEYMVTRHPKGVKSVIFASPLISTPVWMEDARILLSQMPDNLQDTIRKYEALKEYDSPAYLAATDSFYFRYIYRNHNFRGSYPDCKPGKGFNEAVYRYMWGPTEFTAIGTLKNFDRAGDLHTINEPVLFYAGEFDEARPESLYKFAEEIPNASVVIIKNSGHATLHDNPEQVINTLRDFLYRVENVRSPARP